MKKSFARRAVIALVIASMTFAAGAALAASNKEIRVEEGDSSTAASSLKVDFKATKDSFAVDEAISFKFRSNKQAYVYVFNIPENEQKAIQLFPNKFDKVNLVKANKTVIIPSKKSAFKSDSAGVEKIVLVVSEKKLNIQHSESAEGRFYSVDKGLVDSTVKAIRVESGDQGGDAKGKIVRELDVIIQQ